MFSSFEEDGWGRMSAPGALFPTLREKALRGKLYREEVWDHAETCLLRQREKQLQG